MTAESNKQAQPDTKIDLATLDEDLQPVVAVHAALSDAELARTAWRKLMIAAGVCGDLCVAGAAGGAIVNAPEKVGAFIEKAASGFVQLHGVLAGAAAQQAAEHSKGPRPRENDPLAHAIETWSRAG